MIEKILLLSHGIIAVMAEGFCVPEGTGTEMLISVRDFGAEIRMSEETLQLPAAVLEHLVQAEGTNMYFYESVAYELVAGYKGVITLDRDQLLKVKGAWEYSRAQAME